MASQDSGNSFEAIIHADRARKKNEDLANQIFGRAKSNQNVKKNNQKETRSPSLASRMGVQKRSSSTSTPTQKNPFNPPSRPSSTTPSHSFRSSSSRDQSKGTFASRIANEIESGNANITTSSSRNNPSKEPRPVPARNGTGPGLSIKGSAGPFTVHLSNFAPGTTEADIEAALQTDLFDENGTNCLQDCRLISSRPSVVAEMVFTERSVAENIVTKFNNMKADGRMLKVEIVKTGPTKGSERDRTPREGPSIAQSIEATPATQDPAIAAGDMEVDDIDASTDYPATSYDHEREAADRDRRDRDRDRDGYGTRRDERDPDRDRDRDRERRDDRDRDRERDRDRRRDEDVRDRDRERERDRDREYDRRESHPQPQSPAQMQGQGYGNRPPQPAYGNGFSRPPRGQYGYGGSMRGYGFGGRGYGGRGGGAYRGYGR